MRLPPNKVAVPVLGMSESLAIAVLVTVGESPSLDVLSCTADGVVYAGCLLDGLGNAREWLEIWVQTPPLDEEGAALGEANSASLDAGWTRMAEVRHRLEGDRAIGGPWELRHGPPTVLDVPARRAVVLGAGEDGGPWALCDDDAVLEAAGKPRYSGGLARHLWRPVLGDQSPLVAITGEGRSAWRDLAPEGSEFLPFNVQGGLMFVRRRAPVGFEAYVDWLSKGRFHMPPPLRGQGGEPDDRREDPSATALMHGGFLPSIGGVAGLVTEVLFLKLRAIASAVRSVRTATEMLDAPLLSLGSGSFGVELPEADAGLPYAWGSRVVFEGGAESRELSSVDRGAPRRFSYQRPGETGVYRPGGDAGPMRRTMGLRIKRIVRIEAGRVSVEGTVLPREPVRTGSGTLATIPLALPGGRIEFHAHLTHADALSRGELAFTSLPLQIADSELAELARFEGVEVGDAPVVLSPSLSSPADLHALGVLALRTLVSRSAESLGTAVVTAMSLARELPDPGEGGPSVTARVSAVAKSDPRWTAVLGPGCLVAEPELSAVAAEAIPDGLWWGVIGTVCRMFPGAGRDSYCSDFGVGAGRRLSGVYDAPLADLSALVHQTRSLLIVDRRTCEEVGSVIDRRLSLLSP